MRDGIAASSVVPVWPENEAALRLFSALQTQWRVGMGGPTGLDYAVLPAVMDLQDVAHAARSALFADLRIMESEALKVFTDGRNQNQHRHHR